MGQFGWSVGTLVYGVLERLRESRIGAGGMDDGTGFDTDAAGGLGTAETDGD
jgi:hypothetical protein